ncbi:MAG: hypothetical protein LBI91_06020 [Spirochaetaceae bacterium]|jgi:hypothetical protein|nr:hypothetical protein [Spirochaetaceae bacterium]
MAVKFAPFLPCLFLLFAACSEERLPSVAREDLFSLEIGRLEDQIDLFNIEGGRGDPVAALAMRDGLFYISNGNGQKIVRYTSYGDLLFMIYNEETNPLPLTLNTDPEGGGIVTRWAYTYPLREPGAIAVDSRKHIYAGDRFPYERHSYDTENRTLLDSLVLHFDEAGRFVEYLGQEGIGGTPFSRINGLYASMQDELAVVCRNSVGWNVYWFDPDGTLLYLVPIRNDAVPVPQDRSDAQPQVDTVMAAPDKRQLFIKVDYYRATYDESTNTRSGAEPDSSVVWIMDVETGAYADTLEVPFFETDSGQNRRQSEKLFYSMLAVIRDGRVFLCVPQEGGYSLLILGKEAGQGGGLVQRRGFIQVGDDELEFNAFNVSEEGILSGLLATEWEAKLVWWRTDRMASELSQ